MYFSEINEQTVNLSAFFECQHAVQHLTGLLVQWYTFSKNFNFCSQHQILAQLLIVEKIYQSLQSKKVWMFDLHAITFIFYINYYRSPFKTFNHSTFFSSSLKRYLLALQEKIMWMMKWNFFYSSSLRVWVSTLIRNVCTCARLNQIKRLCIDNIAVELLSSSFWPFVIVVVCSQNVSPEITSQFADEWQLVNFGWLMVVICYCG